MSRVFVALSGGVDSAVSAALLKEQGHDVTGVFIKIWSPEFLECTWREDRLDAKRVAATLGIPFLEIDLSTQYRDRVVENMIREYKSGRTPNPDVLCNSTIKFGEFFEWAMKNGADMIATGHYARIRDAKDHFELLKGIHAGKDQSYFLYRLSQKELQKTFFPVGGFTKPEIREKAMRFSLPNATKPDSQGLCFVGDVQLRDFLSRFIHVEAGDVLDEKHRVIGRHDGAAFYTMGQRHGFSFYSEAPEGPYYVTSIDVHKNTVRVARSSTAAQYTAATLSDVHWIYESNHKFEAVVRYHATPVPATALLYGSQAEVVLSQRTSVSPGQSMVFYRAETCLGGGVLETAR